MLAYMLKEGKSVKYTPVAAVTGGDVIESGSLLGVATYDIAAGELGNLAIDGVGVFPKDDAEATFGQVLYWDAANSCFTSTKGALTNPGICVQAAEAGDATVQVKIGCIEVSSTVINDADESQTIDYTPVGALDANDVVESGSLLGFTTAAIEAGELGSLVVDGIGTFPKDDAEATFGQVMYWDSANEYFTSTKGTLTNSGICVEAASAGASTVKIKIG